MADGETVDYAKQALDRLPDRRVASLYDVAVQYSILDWYQTVTSGELDFELDPRHLSFMTPMEKAELYGEGDNALVVNVDLSDPDNPRFDDDQPVELMSVDEGLRYKLGHSYPANKTSNMTDYSVTTQKSASPWHLAGNREGTYGTGNVQDRFTRWAKSEAAETVIETHEEGWIVEALALLGDSSALDRLVTDFPLDPQDQETDLEVFVTVRVKLPGSDGYQWPGEIPVLNEVMVEQKSERLETLNVEEPAVGDGVGYVTGEEGQVTGGSVGLLGMYSKQQREHFADLSPSGEAAWRTRPLTHETAAAVGAVNSIFESFYQSLGESRRQYVLPYLGSHPTMLEPDDIDWFATEVFDRLRNAGDDFDTVVSDIFYRRGSPDSDQPAGLFTADRDAYEFLAVTTVFAVTGNPDRVLFEAVKTDLHMPRSIDVEHGRALRTGPFSPGGAFEGLVDNVDTPLLSPDADRTDLIFFGGYFDWTTAPTRNSEQAERRPRAGTIDDTRASRLRQIMTGVEIPLGPLIEEYIHKLVQRQHTLFSENTDEVAIPAVSIAEQYAQVRALERAGAIDDSSAIATVTQPSTDSVHETREDRLDAFVESHEVLDDDARRAIFLLGGLVGRISAYQRYKEVSSTLVRRYPIDYLTKQSIKEVTSEVLQMNNTYAEADNQPSLNARYVNQLPDLMLGSDPSDWSFPQNELQWIYALGIAFGTNDTNIPSDNDD